MLGTQGFITLEAGIALVFGANVGTCVTAILSSLGRPREAVKAAAVHVMFNLIGVLLWVWFIPYFADLVRALSPAAPGLTGAERLAADVPRQIANAHTIFNIVNTILFIGFAGALANLAERVVPKPRPLPVGEGQPVHLDELYLDQPALALDRVKLELERLAELARRMVEKALPGALEGGDAELNALRQSDENIDALHGAILTYLGQLSLRDLVEPLPQRIQEYISLANYLENVGDAVETGFVSLGYKRLEHAVEFSADTRRRLDKLEKTTITELNRSITAFAATEAEAAHEVITSKDPFNLLADEARVQLALALGRGADKGLAEYRLAIEHVENLKRLHTLARRIARVVLDFHQRDTNSLKISSGQQLDA